MPLDISSGTSSTPASCPPTHQQHSGESNFLRLKHILCDLSLARKKRLKSMCYFSWSREFYVLAREALNKNIKSTELADLFLKVKINAVMIHASWIIHFNRPVIKVKIFPCVYVVDSRILVIKIQISHMCSVLLLKCLAMGSWLWGDDKGRRKEKWGIKEMREKICLIALDEFFSLKRKRVWRLRNEIFLINSPVFLSSSLHLRDLSNFWCIWFWTWKKRKTP